MTSNNFLPELHLKEPIFTYGTCGPFTKHHERIQKLRETGNLKHFYRNELEKLVLLIMQHIAKVKI